MKQTFLDFEQPIADLQAKIDELRYVHEDSAVDISDEINRLQKKSLQLTKEIYAELRLAEDQVARHALRPYTLDDSGAFVSDFGEFPAIARTATTRRSWAASGASTAAVRRSATKKGATPRRRSTATSACRAPRGTARRCAS